MILDAYSRRVIGWALDRTLEDELPLAALRMALSHRNVQPGLVHHSDRGSQYASNEYTDLLKANQIDISMSRKGNPWDNAACESFMKTLKYEEVLRNEYRDLAEARASIRQFVEKIYNRKRLHSALGYLPPRRVRTNAAHQQGCRCAATSLMSFSRRREIYRPMWVSFRRSLGATTAAAPTHRLDEFPAGYSLASCAPAEPASASPAGNQYAVQSFCRSSIFQRTANSVLTVCASRGGKRKHSPKFLPRPARNRLRTTLADRANHPKFLYARTMYLDQRHLTQIGRCRGSSNMERHSRERPR